MCKIKINPQPVLQKCADTAKNPSSFNLPTKKTRVYFIISHGCRSCINIINIEFLLGKGCFFELGKWLNGQSSGDVDLYDASTSEPPSYDWNETITICTQYPTNSWNRGWHYTSNNTHYTPWGPHRGGFGFAGWPFLHESRISCSRHNRFPDVENGRPCSW